MAIEFNLKTFHGLSEQQARERLDLEGYNELPSARKQSILSIALNVLREPMLLLLVGGGVLYFLLGDRQEAVMLLSFVFVVMGITFYQERKSERALEALRDLSSPRALVIRDGREQRIPGREVVRDDILVLHEGDRVAADAIVLSSINLAVDESLLTGESVPVRKTAMEDAVEIGRPGGDDLPFVFSGTLVVQGQAVAQVKKTGASTEIGAIGKVLRTVEREETLLQRETKRLVRNLALFGSLLSIVVAVVYGVTRRDWLHGILAGISLAMALLPEEFPVVLAIFLALGAWRISRIQVLTRRMPAVETLGAATVLCVDKTGTLTLNRMSVRKLSFEAEYWDTEHAGGPLPETFHPLVEFSILASQRDPFDPMEKAIKELGDRDLALTEHLHQEWTLVREYPLSKKLLALSHVWKSPDEATYVVAAKGAPEAIADLCHFDADQVRKMSEHVCEMAEEGLRVLGVARAYFGREALPGVQHDFVFEFLGLIGLADPIRPSVPNAIRDCHTAGIRVVMITGDYPGTAHSIARQLGITPADVSITGPELEALDDEELQYRIKMVNIFARVMPEQKLRLVNALQVNGEIVAMTGDGVNDAPALKSANIGIALGGKGTDVARESSDLVLLDDDFSSIVHAVRMGRRIYDNIRKAICYILAVHVPIAGMSLIPVLLKWPLVLLPVHIVFLELIIDPACSIVFEAGREEADIMKRKPRNPEEPLFGFRSIGISLLQGIGVLCILLVIAMYAKSLGKGEMETRALVFATLVSANIGLIITNLSRSRSIFAIARTSNSALWWVVGSAAALLAAVLYVPFLRDLFRFGTIHGNELFFCIAAGMAGIVWFELLKLVRMRRIPF